MLARLLAFLAAACVSAASLAQTYPSKPVRIIATNSPGGGVDLVARLVAQSLSEQIGQSVFVENRSGAGGAIGASAFSKADPDGYTLLACANAEITVLPHLLQNLRYDPLHDFLPLVLAAAAPAVLVVHPDLPVNNVMELLALAKAKGGIEYGTPGPGTPQHIAFELLRTETGIPLTHVPYKGGSPATADLVAGQLRVALINMPPIMAHIRAGRLKALAVVQSERSNLLPNVPTFKQATGINITDAPSWYGFMAPAQTPPEIISRLESAILKALAEPGVRARLGDAGLDPLALPSKGFSARIREESAAMESSIKRIGLKLQ